MRRGHQQGRTRARQDRADPFCSVLNAVVGRGVFAPENVSDGCREQRIDVTPGKKHQRRNDDEQKGPGYDERERRDGDGFHDKNYGHRVVTSNAI